MSHICFRRGKNKVNFMSTDEYIYIDLRLLILMISWKKPSWNAWDESCRQRWREAANIGRGLSRSFSKKWCFSNRTQEKFFKSSEKKQNFSWLGEGGEMLNPRHPPVVSPLHVDYVINPLSISCFLFFPPFFLSHTLFHQFI